MTAKEEIALTVEIQWKENIETPDWANDLITVMEFLLSKLFEKERTVSVYITDAVEMQMIKCRISRKIVVLMCSPGLIMKTTIQQFMLEILQSVGMMFANKQIPTDGMQRLR